MTYAIGDVVVTLKNFSSGIYYGVVTKVFKDGVEAVWSRKSIEDAIHEHSHYVRDGAPMSVYLSNDNIKLARAKTISNWKEVLKC